MTAAPLLLFIILSCSNNVPQMKAFIMIHDFPTSPNVSGNPASSFTYLKKNNICRIVQVRRLKYLWCDGIYLHEGWSTSVICKRTPSKHRESQWGSDADQLILTPRDARARDVNWPHSCQQVTFKKWGERKHLVYFMSVIVILVVSLSGPTNYS